MNDGMVKRGAKKQPSSSTEPIDSTIDRHSFSLSVLNL